MNNKILIIFVLSFTFSFGSNFWSIDEYVALHPEQRKLMENFNQVVQAEAVSIPVKNEKIKITLIYPYEEVSDYWLKSKKSFELRMQELKIDYDLEAFFINPSDIQSQRAQIINALSNNSNYLIFTLNVSEHQKLISQVISQQKTKVILQNITTPIKSWDNNQPFMYVGFDHTEGTKLLVEYFKKRFPSGAKYIMLYHNVGYVSQMRGDSFISLMGDKYIPSKSFFTYGKSQNAQNALQNLQDDVDFVYSCATDISLGASHGLSSLSKSKEILLNGWGGGDQEINMLKKGEIDVTVMRMNDDNGVAMAEAIKLDITSQSNKIPLIYSGQFVLIDKNIDDTKLDLLKQKAFRYSK
jgi:autoinducer 2-binding protein LuxP